MNSVQLIGRLTDNIDLRYTPTGTAVGSFNLAVDRDFKNQNGERETDFIRCQIWRKSAENLANFTRKGSRIGVQGRIQTGSYEKNGQKTFTTDVVVEKFDLLDSKNSQNNAPQGNNSNRQGNNQGGGNNRPQGNYNAENDPFMSGGQNISIDPDDLPF